MDTSKAKNEENLVYTIASEKVIWEKIGTQVVIADLASGKYCCVDNQSGVLVWDLLITGYTELEIHNILSNHFHVYTKKEKNHINYFINLLAALNFLSPIDHDGTNPSKPSPDTLLQNLSKDFSVPNMLQYNDLDSLLLIDPVDDEIDDLIEKSVPTT